MDSSISNGDVTAAPNLGEDAEDQHVRRPIKRKPSITRDKAQLEQRRRERLDSRVRFREGDSLTDACPARSPSRDGKRMCQCHGLLVLVWWDVHRRLDKDRLSSMTFRWERQERFARWGLPQTCPDCGWQTLELTDGSMSFSWLIFTSRVGLRSFLLLLSCFYRSPLWRAADRCLSCCVREVKNQASTTSAELHFGEAHFFFPCMLFHCMPCYSNPFKKKKKTRMTVETPATSMTGDVLICACFVFFFAHRSGVA